MIIPAHHTSGQGLQRKRRQDEYSSRYQYHAYAAVNTPYPELKPIPCTCHREYTILHPSTRRPKALYQFLSLEEDKQGNGINDTTPPPSQSIIKTEQEAS